MILNLFPKRPDHPLADGKEFKRILAELQVEKPEQAVEEVGGWLQSLQNGDAFRLDDYFEILRQLDEAAQQHLRRLARQYLQPARLSALEEQRRWARIYDYWGNIAARYAACVERARLDPKGRGTEAFKAALPLTVARLQAARCRRVKWLAYRYGPLDENLWQELGKTNVDSEAAGYGQKAVQLYPAKRGLTTAAQQYLHAIVFFTSSMDSLMPLQIELADRLIAHFLPRFVLSADCRPDSVYWVDAAAGSIPMRLARHPGAARPGLRFFYPGAALESLEELIQLVEQGEIPQDLNLGGEYPQRALLPVLRHLRVYWALRPPRRRHQRHTVKTRMAVLNGFEHCHALFSEAHSSSTGVAQPTESWVVENVSHGGFQACFGDAPEARPKLGDLLAVQPEGGDNWLLGVAKRFNRLPGSRARLGVQLLAREARGVTLQPWRSGFSVAVGIPGIWLPRNSEANILRIVLPYGAFNIREALEFSYQDRRYTLAPVELEESGGDYEIGCYREQQAR